MADRHSFKAAADQLKLQAWTALPHMRKRRRGLGRAQAGALTVGSDVLRWTQEPFQRMKRSKLSTRRFRPVTPTK
jgi:hypothetical protein